MLRAVLAALAVATVATSADAQSTGLPGCDELLGKMERCARNEPKAVQKHSREMADLTRRQVGDMTRQLGKQEAENFCRSMIVGYRKAGYGKEYGCRF